MSTYPPHMAAAKDRGREIRRCPNVGCGLMRQPDTNDPRILRCNRSCTMQRAKTIEFTRDEIERKKERERVLAHQNSVLGRHMQAAE